jgi:hypothetical protein
MQFELRVLLLGSADLQALWSGKRRVISVQMQGLQIGIPPRAEGAA